MNLAQLDAALAIRGGNLVLGGGAGPGAGLDRTLAAFNGAKPLTIGSAKKTKSKSGITVRGQTSFLNVAGAPVTATFGLNRAGNPTATIKITLIDGEPGPRSWRFSRSFPGLPDFPDAVGPAKAKFLDSLRLSDAAFVLTTTSGTEPSSRARLVPGLNFVAELVPTGVAALVDAMAGGDRKLRLSGPIAPARASSAQPPDIHPWSVPDEVPGILLQAPLGVVVGRGGVQLDHTRLRIYSPLAAPAGAAPGYPPQLGLSGRIKIASAGVAVAATGSLTPGSKSITIEGTIAGASINGLAALADLAPGEDLNALLPSEVRSALKGVALSLNGATLGVSGQPSGPSFDVVGVEVGFAGVNWSVFDGLTVRADSIDFLVANPLSRDPEVAAIVNGQVTVGGISLDVRTQVPEFTVWASLADEATIPLRSLFAQAAPQLPAPPDLTIDTLDLAVAPRKSYSLAATLADEPGWTLDLDPVQLTIADVTLELAKAVGADATGLFAGSLQLGGADVYAEYELPGALTLRADLPSTRLSALTAPFAELGLELPSGFDPEFAQSYMLLTAEGDGVAFTAASEVSGLGLVAFTVQRASGQTGLAIGIELDDVPSKVAGLEALAAFGALIGLEKAMLVVSSLDDPGFQFPAMAAFKTPALAGKSLALPPQASGLSRGLNVYAKLSVTRSQAFQALANWLGVTLDGTVDVAMGVSLPDPTSNSKVYLTVDTQIDSVTSVDAELGFLMAGGQPAAFLNGVVQTSVDGSPLTFAVTAEVLPNGVLVLGTMLGSLTFGPVTLSNLALMVGIDFEGLPSLGIAATIDVDRFESSVAVFFDSTQPSKSMVAGSISSLSLRDIAEVLAQQTLEWPVSDVLESIALRGRRLFTIPATRARSLDARDLGDLADAFQQFGNLAIPRQHESVLLVVNEAGAAWHVTDLTTMKHYALTVSGEAIDVSLDPQFRIAPQETRIGSLPPFREGIFLSAELDFLTLRGQLEIEVEPTRGIHAEAALDPVVLFSEDLFSITDASGAGGPELSLSTYSRPEAPEGRRDPHMFATGRLRMLGIDMVAILVEINPQGAAFTIKTQLTPLVHLDIGGAIKSAESFSAHGTAVVGLNASLDLGRLGSLAINTSCTGSLSIELDDGGVTAEIDGSFDFRGETFSIPTLTLPIGSSTLTSLDTLLLEEAKSLLGGLAHDFERWGAWLEGNLIQGFESATAIAQVVAREFLLAAEKAAQLLDRLGHEAEEIVTALHDAFALDAVGVVRTLEQAGLDAERYATGVAAHFGLAWDDTARAFRDAGAGVSVVVGVLQRFGIRMTGNFTAALLVVGYGAERVVAELSLLGHTPDAIATGLRDAGIATGAIASAFSTGLGWPAEQVGGLLNQIGTAPVELAQTMQNVYGWTDERVQAFCRDTLGFGADALGAVGNALGIAGSTIEDVATDAGNFFEHDIGGAIKGLFG